MTHKWSPNSLAHLQTTPENSLKNSLNSLFVEWGETLISGPPARPLARNEAISRLGPHAFEPSQHAIDVHNHIVCADILYS